MLGEFRIETARVRNCASGYRDIYQKMEQCGGELEDVLQGLRDHVYGNVPNALRRTIESNEANIQDVRKLEEALLLIVQKYQEAEKRITGGDASKEWMIPEEAYTSASEGVLNGGSQDVNLEEESENAVWEYIKDALGQAAFGDFTDDSNLLGILLSVGIGFIPYVGQAADLRDLIADIWNLIDDGPETKEWVALGFTLVGIIPGIGDFCKHADEMGPLFTHLDDIADGLGDFTKGVMKKGDEIYSAVGRHLDEIGDFVDQRLLGGITDKIDNFTVGITDKIDDFIDGIPGAGDVVDKVSDIWEKKIGKSTIGDAISDVTDGITGFTDTVQEGLADTWDFLTGKKKEEVGSGVIVSNGFSYAY